jgi:hypothetical protein
MHKKSDALKSQRGYSKQAWDQSGKRIIYLRCDKAKELLNSEIKKCLSSQGTAEENNSTIMKEMRSMLKGAGVPKKL